MRTDKIPLDDTELVLEFKTLPYNPYGRLVQSTTGTITADYLVGEKKSSE